MKDFLTQNQTRNMGRTLTSHSPPKVTTDRTNSPTLTDTYTSKVGSQTRNTPISGKLPPLYNSQKPYQENLLGQSHRQRIVLGTTSGPTAKNTS